jgi:exodeoxyribonuclease VII large subunit
MDNKALTVTEATRYIKNLLEKDDVLSRIFITGEVSNLKYYKLGGQIYFTLKDGKCQLNCVIFESIAKKLKYELEDGMTVNIVGRISVFEKRGQYNLQVFAIEPQGIGPLALAFEQLKKKLEEKGLFEQSRKRDMDQCPDSVGIITSPSGAALWDIVAVARRLAPYVKIYIYPAIVQGENAPQSLLKALELANKHNKADVIIIGRGGGSLEELFGFNDETLAYAISESKIPVISAVGHEVDFSISDFVADMRAPTPSAAAEMLFVDKVILETKIKANKEKMIQFMSYLVDDTKMLLDNSMSSLNEGMKSIYLENNNEYKNLLAKLEALNPFSVMKRGYSVSKNNDVVIKSVKDCAVGDGIVTEVVDGEILTKVFQLNQK